MTPRWVDVLVVGAGPAGATAALCLARAGARTALVDRPHRQALRIGEGLPPAARPVLESLGLWERFLADGHLPSYGNRSAWGAPDLVDTDFVFGAYGPGWHLDRPRFDRMLASSAEENGAVRLSAAGVGWADRALVVKGSSATTPIRVGVVVDCTGRAAALARRTGARRPRHDRLVAVAALHAVGRRSSGDVDATTLVEAAAQGWWYSSLLPGRRRLFAYLTDADLVESGGTPDVEWWRRTLVATEHVRAIHERYKYEPLAPPTVIPAGSSVLQPCCGRGWSAAGDAALTVDPLSSQGILNAIITGRAAADAALEELDDLPGSAAYATLVDGLDRGHRARQAAYYAQERRWPESTFWLRRQAPANHADHAVDGWR